MSSLIRTGQPGVTNVFPHAGNRRYIVGASTQKQRAYYNFEVNSACSGGSKTWNTASAYKFIIKFRLEATGTQLLFGHLNSSNRCRIAKPAASDVFQWRCSAGSVINHDSALSQLVNYQATVEDAAGDGNVTIDVLNLDSGAAVGVQKAGTTNSANVIGSMVVGHSSSGFDGRIWDIEWYEASTLIHSWPADEGSGTNIFDAEGSYTLTGLTNGVWEEDRDR